VGKIDQALQAHAVRAGEKGKKVALPHIEETVSVDAQDAVRPPKRGSQAGGRFLQSFQDCIFFARELREEIVDAAPSFADVYSSVSHLPTLDSPPSFLSASPRFKSSIHIDFHVRKNQIFRSNRMLIFCAQINGTKNRYRSNRMLIFRAQINGTKIATARTEC